MPLISFLAARPRALLLCLATLACPATHSEPIAHHLTRADGSTLTYYLQSPAQALADRQDLLLIVQGSDCNSVAHNSAVWDVLAQARPQAQVLAVDKYGIDASLPYQDLNPRADCPRDYLQHDSPAQRVADLSAVLDQLASKTAYDNVIALGGSEGAVIVHLLAARALRLDAAVSFNGGGRWFEDDMLHSVMAENLPPTERDAAVAGLHAFAQQARAGLDHPQSDHGRDWWQQMLALDQSEVLRAISIPTLVVQAGRDASVSPEAASALQAENDNPRVFWRHYPELDHGLREPDGSPAMARVTQDIANWLARQLDTAG